MNLHWAFLAFNWPKFLSLFEIDWTWARLLGVRSVLNGLTQMDGVCTGPPWTWPNLKLSPLRFEQGGLKGDHDGQSYKWSIQCDSMVHHPFFYPFDYYILFSFDLTIIFTFFKLTVHFNSLYKWIIQTYDKSPRKSWKIRNWVPTNTYYWVVLAHLNIHYHTFPRSILGSLGWLHHSYPVVQP